MVAGYRQNQPQDRTRASVEKKKAGACLPVADRDLSILSRRSSLKQDWQSLLPFEPLVLRSKNQKCLVVSWTIRERQKVDDTKMQSSVPSAGEGTKQVVLAIQPSRNHYIGLMMADKGKVLSHRRYIWNKQYSRITRESWALVPDLGLESQSS